MEVYAKIKGFENYAISNGGIVINIKTGRKLKSFLSHGYLRTAILEKKFMNHRLVAEAYLDKIENKNIVDHIDCNKTNNHVSNLRWCNSSENAMNTKINSRNVSGVRGVRYDTKSKKWRAYISFNNKRIYLGFYDNLEDAKIARQNKSSELFKEFQNECEK